MSKKTHTQEFITEEEFQRLIRVANHTRSDAERIADFIEADPGIPVRGWKKYIGLDSGPNLVHEALLQLAMRRFFDRKGMDLPPAETSKIELSRALRWTRVAGETFYKCNLSISELFHLSAPNGKVKYGLFKNAIPKIKQPYFDYDYLGKLTEREKVWFHKFNEEYYNNRFRNNETDFHASAEEKRQRYANNNAIGRDSYAIWDSCGALNHLVERKEWAWSDTYDFTETCLETEVFPGAYHPEDAIIDYIDTMSLGDQIFWTED